jgi:hypothetical protein
VVCSFDYGNIQIRIIAIDMSESDFSGILKSTISFPPSLKRSHFLRHSLTFFKAFTAEIGVFVFLSLENRRKRGIETLNFSGTPPPMVQGGQRKGEKN